MNEISNRKDEYLEFNTSFSSLFLASMTKLPDGATYSHLSPLLSLFPMTSVARSLFSASASGFRFSIAQARLFIH